MGGLVSASGSHNSSDSQSTSQSGNQSYDYLKNALGSTVSSGVNSASTYADAINGGSGADASYKKYQASTGFQDQLQQGSNAVSGQYAAKGALNSGATLKALTKYGSNLAQQNYSNYLGNLATSAGLGNSAANTISGAGQYSNSQSTSSSSGTSGSVGFSDARLKNLDEPQHDYTLAIRNLWVGDFSWRADGTPSFGIIAQQAAQFMPYGAGLIPPSENQVFWRVQKEPFAWLALWGVKQLYNITDDTNTKLAELQTKLDALQKQVDDLLAR
jgi:hypothetical protein